MQPKILGSILAVFVLAISFAVSYGQQRVEICETGNCPVMVEMPQAKIDSVVEVVNGQLPAFPVETRYVQSQRTTTTRTGLLQRLFRPLSRLRGLSCRR